MENSISNSKYLFFFHRQWWRVCNNSKSDKIEILINNEADKVINELSDSLKNKYQNNLESMKGSEIVFDYVHLLYYECHKINPNCGGSDINSPIWIKTTTIISINKKITNVFNTL